MSRAYRIRVRESLRKTVRAADHVSTQLELLALLPPEQMAELLAAELEQRGFKRQGDRAVRQQDGGHVSVDLATATVTVQATGTREVAIEGESDGYATDDRGESAKRIEKHLRGQLQKSLQERAAGEKTALQTEVTDKLEAQLGELRKELDQVVNRVTVEALKRKAAQLGTIKQVTEDGQGSMTIVLEV
jgi:hypothetical protein